MQRKINLVAVGATVLFLTACSANPSKQDVGMVTGAVAGGYVGRVVGKELERK